MKGNGGVGFVSLLTVAFIALKLTGNITWSWWWVFSPMWIDALFILLLIIIVATVQTFRD